MTSTDVLAQRPPLRVIVVDDVAEIRDIVTMMLEADRRFRIVGQASSGQQAIECAARERPDVVLLDIEMPDMDGWETLPRLKEVSPDSSVVIFSGDASPAARRTAVERGAAGHLVKGVEARQLAAQLLAIVVGEPTVQFHAEPSVQPAPPPAPTPASDEMARRHLAAIVESSEVAIILLALDGTIESWNRGAQRLYGYEADDIIGTSISRLAPDDGTDEAPDVLERVRAGEVVEHYETVSRRKDTVLIDISISVSPVRDERGAVIGAAAIARDIGDRRRRDRAFARALAQLERQNQELRHTNEELDRFAYVASHDLAQPLQVMYGYLELLQMEYGDTLDDTAREWLKLAVTNVERMRQLVRDLLQYARVGSAQGARNAVSCDEVLHDALGVLGQLINERSAKVTSSSLPVVTGDRTQLGQLFQNLVGNAIKYTPADRRPAIRVETTAEGDMCRIDVIDNGTGVPVESRERIFEMFQRAHSDTEGTGLGLSICKRVVERHGGRLWVEDAPGGGSRFSFTLQPAS